jgi:hypothetical protein
MTRAFLKAKYLEEDRILWYCFEAAIVILAFAARQEASFGLALLVTGIYLGAWFSASFHARYGIEVLLSGCGFYRRKQAGLLILAGLVLNAPLGLAVLAYAALSNGSISVVCLLYAVILYLFANAFGLLIGSCVRKTVGGLALCTLASALNFLEVLVLEQELRFFSPVVQIGNLGRFQWWNLLVLLTAAAMIDLWSLSRKRAVILAGLLGIAAILLTDLALAKNERKVSPDYEAYASEAIGYVNGWNALCGFPSYGEIVIYKSVYYPWMPGKAKRPVYAEGDVLYMNCFTESLCSLDRREIILRAVASILKPKPGAQNAMAGLYQQWLLGRKQAVYEYLESSQIQRQGRIYDRFLGLAAEVLVYHPERYGELYELAGAYGTREEVTEAWGKMDEPSL